MVKDDNDLLYEWLAYHYTVLPLGYVVVGADIGSSQDPDEVLQRWKTEPTGLRSWVLHSEDFIHRHGNYYEHFGGNRTEFPTEDEQRKYHHHALIYRQKGFITACAERLQAEGVGWTLFIDSDEFLAMNPMTEDDKDLQADGEGQSLLSNHSREIRTRIRDEYVGKRTVADLIRDTNLTSDMGSCYTIPRLLFGALENATCNDESIAAMHGEARAFLKHHYDKFSTLRFFQHAKKGDFATSKFGKVMMDLSRVPRDILKSRVPSNIHRPFRDLCGPAGAAPFPNAFFFVAHYIGGWDRYASRRGDHRRTYGEWYVRSALVTNMSSSMACASIIPWFVQFARSLGDDTAQFLLGGSSDQVARLR